MKELWRRLSQKMAQFFLWALDEHPGKLVGTVGGFLLGLMIILLGLWRALVLAMCVTAGFLLGKRQDDHKDVAGWIQRLLDK